MSFVIKWRRVWFGYFRPLTEKNDDRPGEFVYNRSGSSNSITRAFFRFIRINTPCLRMQTVSRHLLAQRAHDHPDYFWYYSISAKTLHERVGCTRFYYVCSIYRFLHRFRFLSHKTTDILCHARTTNNRFAQLKCRNPHELRITAIKRLFQAANCHKSCIWCSYELHRMKWHFIDRKQTFVSYSSIACAARKSGATGSGIFGTIGSR